MVERNGLVEGEIPSSLRGALRQTALAIDHEFLHIYGSGGTGLNAKVPWVLISDKRFTESAQNGWYLVLLFAEDGSGLNLSLNKNSTTSVPNLSGKWTADPLPDYQMKDDRVWALSLLRDQIQASPLELSATLNLHTTSGPGRAYEKTHVVGRYYPQSALPDEGEIASDLSVLSGFLQTIYRSLATGPEHQEPLKESPTTRNRGSSETVMDPPATDRPGRQHDTAVKDATERHAVMVATDYLQEQGYEVEDVGSVKSYDLKATKGTEMLCVEVKGSTMAATSVTLTDNEVQVARKAKDTLLIVVDKITYQRVESSIETYGGRIRTWWGWRAHESLLQPKVYRYDLPEEEPNELKSQRPDGRY